jgi:hypothetical protein
MIFLNKEENEKFGSQIDGLGKMLKESLVFLKDNLIAFNGIEFHEYQQYFLSIVGRFQLNIESLIPLVALFKEDHRHKFPVALISRCICSDILTALYLKTFIDYADPKQQTLRNEIDIIGTENLRFLEEFQTELYNFAKVVAQSEKPDPDFTKLDKDHKGLMEWLKNQNPDYYKYNPKKGGLAIKAREDFRVSSNQSMITNLKNGNGFLSEKEKSIRIKEVGMVEFGYVFIAFKYYSQYHHYSIQNHILINQKPFIDTHFLFNTIDHMLVTTVEILRLLNSPNKSFVDQFEKIKSNIDLKDYPFQ